MVFAARSEELVKERGQIAFVVPKVLTYAHRWANSRRYLLEQDLNYVIDLGESLEGVKQEQIVLMFTPSERDEAVIVGRRENNGVDGNEFFEKEYQQTGFTEDCFALWVDDRNESALEKLSEYDTFDDLEIVNATKGIDNFKTYLTGMTDDLLAYRGDDVGQFRFVQESYLDQDILNRSDSHLAGHGEEKIVFQRILPHIKTPTDRIVIQCAIDYDGACIPDTSIHATSDEYSLETLCGLVNSSLFAWYAYNMIYNRAIRSMDLTPIYFGRLPAPPRDDEDLIEMIEAKTTEIVDMDEGHEQDLLDAYDELDNAVFELYQLTDEEKEVIKEETPPHKETLCSW